MKYGDSGHRYTASQRRRYLAPSFSPFRRFRSLSLPLLSPSPRHGPVSPFSYSFPRVPVYVHVRRGVPPGWRGPHPPYTAVFHIIYNPRPARCPRNNSVSDPRTCERVAKLVETVRGRRNLSRPVTTLSDVVVQGSDVRMCPLEDEGKYDCTTIPRG